MEPSKPDKTKKRKVKKAGRIERYKRQARQIREDPKSIGTMIRDGLVGVWRARGGGFYGLGYLITFMVLEIRLVVGDLSESEGVVEFVSSQLIEFIFRFGIQSFINGFLAFMWPVYILDWLGPWGVAVLIGGYFGFEKLLRLAVEGWLAGLPSQPAASSTNEDEVHGDR